MIEAVKRTVKVECIANRSPKEPEFKIYNEYPATINAKKASLKLQETFKKYLGEDRLEEDYS